MSNNYFFKKDKEWEELASLFLIVVFASLISLLIAMMYAITLDVKSDFPTDVWLWLTYISTSVCISFFSIESLQKIEFKKFKYFLLWFTPMINVVVFVIHDVILFRNLLIRDYKHYKKLYDIEEEKNKIYDESAINKKSRRIS